MGQPADELAAWPGDEPASQLASQLGMISRPEPAS